jgi:hypothetical protein
MMKESYDYSRVVSRRQQQQQPQQPLHSQQASTVSSPSNAHNGGSMEMLPLHHRQQQMHQPGPSSSSQLRAAKRKASDQASPCNINSGMAILPAPPRSTGGGGGVIGGSVLPSLSSLPESLEDFFGGGGGIGRSAASASGHASDDATAKKGRRRQHQYQVQMPSRLLGILALVFLIVPILIFMHKEANIRSDRVAHYRTEKFINVNTEDVFSTFREATASGGGAGGLEGTESDDGAGEGGGTGIDPTNHKNLTAGYLLAADASVPASTTTTGLNRSAATILDHEGETNARKASSSHATFSSAMERRDPNAPSSSSKTSTSTNSTTAAANTKATAVQSSSEDESNDQVDARMDE